MRRIPLLSLLTVAALAACAPALDTEGIDEGAHTEGQYAAGNSPFFWANVDYEEASRLTNGFYASQIGEVGPILPADHPLTVRMQAWLDRIDGVVRPAVEAAQHAPLLAPRPIAKIVRTGAMFNAWVTPVAACASGLVVGSDATATEEPLLLNRSSVAPPTRIGLAPGCASPREWPGAGSFLQQWNASRPACRLRRDGQGIQIFGDACNHDAHAGTPLAITATLPFIHFSSDYLAEMTEVGVVEVAAHELGHFYRAHVSPLREQKYSFWYETSSSARRPIPSALESELRGLYEDAASGQHYPRGVEGAHFDRRLIPFLIGPLNFQLNVRPEPDFRCVAARDALRAPWVPLIQSPWGPPDVVREKYLDFERKLLDCAGGVRLAPSGAADALPQRELLDAATALKFGDLGQPQTLGELLERVQASANKKADALESFRQRMKENSVGLYTIEQEADEIALDVATKLGFTGDELLAARLDELRVTQRRFGLFGGESVGADECEALLHAGFTRTTAAGVREDVRVDLGDLDEPHHASCYRIFNDWRELKAHAYVVGPPQAPLEPPWADIRRVANEVSGFGGGVVPEGDAGAANGADGGL